LRAREGRHVRVVAASRLGAHLTASVGAALALTGCILEGPVIRLGAISTRDLAVEGQFLVHDIGGHDCPEEHWGIGDYGAAVESALQRVPDADALINVRFFRVEKYSGHVCVFVVGDAVRLR
jgi:hypothetical protein